MFKIIWIPLCLVIMACEYPQSSIDMNVRQLKDAEAKLLQNPNDRQALEFILSRLHDSHGINRVNAASVLGDAGSKIGSSLKDQAVPALSELLDKGDAFDKRAAAEALAQFGRYAQAALPVLKKNLIPGDRDVAWFSARALGEIGEPAKAAVPEFVQAIHDNATACEGFFSNFCESFIPALGKIGPSAKAAIPELDSLLSHHDAYVRMRAAVALMRIDPTDQHSLDALDKILHDQDSELRRRTMLALVECGDKARPAEKLIQDASKDDNEEVRREASSLLKLLNR
jgi:HEAT repeat protein